MALFTEQETKPDHEKTITLVIDADSLIYEAAYLGDKHYRGIESSSGVFQGLQRSLLEDQIEILEDRVSTIQAQVAGALAPHRIGIEKVIPLFTPKASACKEAGEPYNFRYALIDEFNSKYKEDIPGYKANRATQQPLPNMAELYAHAAQLENAVMCWGCEADDVAYRMKIDDPDGVIIACKDKDVYSGTPTFSLGHFNFGRYEWVHTTEDEANLFYYRQCMTGDRSDGIKGIYRFGIKTAEVVLPKWLGHEESWAVVEATFIKYGYTKEYALLMMRLVNLNSLDERLKVQLWKPRWIS